MPRASACPGWRGCSAKGRVGHACLHEYACPFHAQGSASHFAPGLRSTTTGADNFPMMLQKCLYQTMRGVCCCPFDLCTHQAHVSPLSASCLCHSLSKTCKSCRQRATATHWSTTAPSRFLRTTFSSAAAPCTARCGRPPSCSKARRPLLVKRRQFKPTLCLFGCSFRFRNLFHFFGLWRVFSFGSLLSSWCGFNFLLRK